MCILHSNSLGRTAWTSTSALNRSHCFTWQSSIREISGDSIRLDMRVFTVSVEYGKKRLITFFFFSKAGSGFIKWVVFMFLGFPAKFFDNLGWIITLGAPYKGLGSWFSWYDENFRVSDKSKSVNYIRNWENIHTFTCKCKFFFGGWWGGKGEGRCKYFDIFGGTTPRLSSSPFFSKCWADVKWDLDYID